SARTVLSRGCPGQRPRRSPQDRRRVSNADPGHPPPQPTVTTPSHPLGIGHLGADPPVHREERTTPPTTARAPRHPQSRAGSAVADHLGHPSRPSPMAAPGALLAVGLERPGSTRRYANFARVLSAAAVPGG